jgi:hypothetical protein
MEEKKIIRYRKFITQTQLSPPTGIEKRKRITNSWKNEREAF